MGTPTASGRVATASQFAGAWVATVVTAFVLRVLLEPERRADYGLPTLHSLTPVLMVPAFLGFAVLAVERPPRWAARAVALAATLLLWVFVRDIVFDTLIKPRCAACDMSGHLLTYVVCAGLVLFEGGPYAGYVVLPLYLYGGWWTAFQFHTVTESTVGLLVGLAVLAPFDAIVAAAQGALSNKSPIVYYPQVRHGWAECPLGGSTGLPPAQSIGLSQGRGRTTRPRGPHSEKVLDSCLQARKDDPSTIADVLARGCPCEQCIRVFRRPWRRKCPSRTASEHC